MFALLGVSISSPALAQEKSWFRIASENGQQIGIIWQTREALKEGFRTTEVSEIRSREREYSVRRIVERTEKTEDKNGRLILIAQSSTAAKRSTRTTATIGPDFAEIVRETGTDRRKKRIALPPDVRFDNGTKLLRGWQMDQLPKLEFDNFSLAAEAVEHVEIAPIGKPDAEGKITLLRSSYDGADLRSVARIDLDSNRRILRTTQMMFGTRITIEPAGSSIANWQGPVYSLVRNAMVKSPFRVPPSAAQGHIRYTFGFREGLRFTLPQTGEQRVTLKDGAVIVDICKSCGVPTPLTEAQRTAARSPTAWMQSDNSLLQSIAKPIADSKASPADKMRALAGKARLYLRTIDFAGHFSALEALERRSGDCTEDAVVLAALGRAAGIPTRVASGIVYSRERYHGVSNAFLPHSWVLAWIEGRWQSFDMSIGEFDSTHIVLTIGDGDARSITAANQLISLLEWQAMTEVKKRPE